MNELQNMAEETARRGVEREAHEEVSLQRENTLPRVGSLILTT